MNQITITGNAAAAPELRQTKTGKAVTTIRVAVRDWRAKDDDTLWLGVVCWDKTAEIAADRVQKGTQIMATGRLQVRTYQDREGNERTSVEVVASDIEYGERQAPREQQGAPRQQGPGGGSPYGPPPGDDDDSVPF